MKVVLQEDQNPCAVGLSRTWIYLSTKLPENPRLIPDLFSHREPGPGHGFTKSRDGWVDRGAVKRRSLAKVITITVHISACILLHIIGSTHLFRPATERLQKSRFLCSSCGESFSYPYCGCLCHLSKRSCRKPLLLMLRTLVPCINC
jgi:transposase-like protein